MPQPPKPRSRKTSGVDASFRRKNRDVVIRTEGERMEIVVEGTPHEVRFLDNGRPYTRAFVSTEATSVRDLAERFVDQMAAQEAHWAEVAAARAKDRKTRKDETGEDAPSD